MGRLPVPKQTRKEQLEINRHVRARRKKQRKEQDPQKKGEFRTAGTASPTGALVPLDGTGGRCYRGRMRGGGVLLPQRRPAPDFDVGRLPAPGDNDGLFRRRSKDRRVLQGTANHQAPVPNAPHADGGLYRCRGCPVLQAPGGGPDQHHPGFFQEPRGRHHCPGREHHHPTGHQVVPAHPGAKLYAKDPRGDSGLPHRQGLFQGRGPFSLPEPDLPGPRGLRCGSGR